MARTKDYRIICHEPGETIHHRKSGRGINRRYTSSAKTAAQEVRVTQRAGEAETLAREAIRAGSDYVVAVGADGTFNEVINGIATPRRAHDVCVGVVPLGTANDFARSIGLMGDVDATIDILRAKTTAAIDLVRMTSGRRRYFVNVSAGGFSGVVDEKLTSEIKSAWGALAYLRSAAAALPELQAHRTTLIFDDAEQFGDRPLQCRRCERTIRRRRAADRAGESQRLIARCCARTETSGSGNGAAGRGDAFGQAPLRRCRYFSACKEDLSPVAAGNVVQCGRRTGRK